MSECSILSETVICERKSLSVWLCNVTSYSVQILRGLCHIPMCFNSIWSSWSASADSSAGQVCSLREGFITIIRVRVNIEVNNYAKTTFHPQRLSYRLQLVSGGGDRYTEPYGQLSMWNCRLRKQSCWLKVLAESTHSFLWILSTQGDKTKSTDLRVVSQINQHLVSGE